MILPELLPVLAIHLYALGTAAVVAGILARNEWLKRAALVLTVLAFTTHTLLLIATFMDDGFTGLTRSVYVQLLAWCITLSGLVAWLRWRYEALLLTVAPFSLLTFLIALLPHWTRSMRSRRRSVFRCSRQACFLGLSRPASIGAQSFPEIPKSLFRSLSGACTLGFSTSGSRRAGKDANRQFWQYGSSRFARFRSSW